MLSISLLGVGAIVLASVILGAFTFLNSPKQRVNQSFAVICICLGAWASANYIADNYVEFSLLWSRVSFFSVTIALIAIAVFAINFPRRIFSYPLERILIGIGIIEALVVWLPGFIPGVEVQQGVGNVVPGPLYPTFLVYMAAYFVMAMGCIVWSARHNTGVNLARVRLMLVGFGAMIVLASITNLILPLILGNNGLAWLGAYFSLIFIGTTAYAIIRQRLFNIRLVVARSATYILLLGTLALIYGVAIFGISAFVFESSQVTAAERSINVAIAIVLAFTFQPLRRFFERLTDNIFFRDHYDSQQALNDIGQIVVAEFRLDRVLRKTLIRICADLKVANGLFYVFDDDKIYRIERYGAVQRHPLTAAELKQFRHRITVADELEGGRLKTQMEEHGYRVVIHLSTKEEFVGYLVLGDKLSGDIYTDQDIEVLQILAQELAVAISNAKAYQEIANFNATLQHKVAVATKRLREANIHLKELDKAKDEFISMASHQLRTPLTTIKGYLSMLDEGDAGKLTKQQREFVGYAYAGSERMVNLISDLLNVSRMSTGKFLISKTPIDLIKMAADEVQQLQSHAKAKGLELIFAPQNKPLPSVMLDDNKTRQVIMNFIDNAIYYTKAGSVKVGVAQVGKRVELRVTDTGIGVPKEAQKQLFTKFYRAANAQNVRPDGTGLGLYLAKRVVEDQGGTIIFETTEGKGSTFGFSLPLTTNQEASDAASQ